MRRPNHLLSTGTHLGVGEWDRGRKGVREKEMRGGGGARDKGYCLLSL